MLTFEIKLNELNKKRRIIRTNNKSNETKSNENKIK